MPFIDVIIPRCRTKALKELSLGMTEEFCRITGFEREILAIHFTQYETISIAGKFVEKGYVHVHIFIPRIEKGVKTELIAKFSEMVKKEFKCDPVVHISEHPYDNIGVSGKSLSELIPELGERKFYYDV